MCVSLVLLSYADPEKIQRVAEDALKSSVENGKKS
jgi:hypothetical protein